MTHTMTTTEEMATTITRKQRQRIAAALNDARIQRQNTCIDEKIQTGGSYAGAGAIRLNRADAIRFFTIVARGGERSLVDFTPDGLTIHHQDGSTTSIQIAQCDERPGSYSGWVDGAAADRMVAALEEVDISAYPHAYGHWARYVQLRHDRSPFSLGINAHIVIADARHASVLSALTGRDDAASAPYAVRIGTWVNPEERREAGL